MQQNEMREKGLVKRRETRAACEKEARELYDKGTEVTEIAAILGKKYKRNGKPYSIFTIYEYLGGVRKPKKDA